MRFMMLMIPKGYEGVAPGTMPDARAVEAMMKYNKLLQEAGVLLSLEGLHPPSAGGKVLGEPWEIPGVGLYVSFIDQEGNRASMLQPARS